MRTRLSKVIVAISVGCILAAPSLSQFAGAYPSYYTAFSSRYPSTALLNSYGCNVCHKDRANVACRNPYGSSISEAGGGTPEGFAAVEGLDSDGDGVTNLDEIIAGTPPGRPDAVFIVNRLLGLAPAANGDADVNCDACADGCFAEVYVVDCADVIDALKPTDAFNFPNGRYESVIDRFQE